jgi:glycine cleavage system regulatory protein
MSINTSLVLTIMGKDRPGLVKNLSKIITDHGGDWLDSHLAEVAGYFGGLLQVSVPEEKADALSDALGNLKSEGLEVLLMPSSEVDIPPDSLELQLSVVGNDRPGIVSHVTDVIASHGANLLALETEYSSAPMSGQEIFNAMATIQLPSEDSLAAIRSDLEKIASDLMVDISVGE